MKNIKTLSNKLATGLSVKETSTLYNEIYRFINRFAIKLFTDDHKNSLSIFDEAEEFTSEMMVRVFDRLDMWDSKKGALTTWIGTLCYNRYATLDRTRIKHIYLSQLGFDAAYGANRSISKNDFIKLKDERFIKLPVVYDTHEKEYNKMKISNMLSKLKEHHREVIKLYFGIDRESAVSSKVIANIMGITQARVCQIVSSVKY